MSTTEPHVEAEPSTETESNEASTGTGLESNVAGALSYLLGPITGILFYLVESEDAFVRFHGAQSTIVFGGFFVASIVLSVLATVLAFVPVVGWIAGLFLGLVGLLLAPLGLVLWVLLMYKAYQGEEYALPVAGGYAHQYAAVDETS